MNVCRICDESLSYVETVTGCRYEQFSLRSQPFKLVTKDVALYQCKHCSHVQSNLDLSASYYEEYSSLQGAAQYYGDLKKIDKKLQRLRGFLSNEYDTAEITFLDIGCGAGEALAAASCLFSTVRGIEPSQTAEVARKAGFDVVHDYFGDHLGMIECLNAFSAFQVYEHLENPLKVLRATYQALVPGGVGLINVPNGQMIAENGMYHQIVCEHINYFTPYSLMTMAKLSGFDVIEINNNTDTFELDLYIKKPIRKKPDVKTGLAAHKQIDQQMLWQIIKQYDRIAVWGAGAKTIVYSQLLPPDVHIIHCFDGDNNKSGLFVSGINTPVEPPSKKTLDECDVVLIFASSYTDQIMQELKNTYKYQGAVVLFDSSSIIQSNMT